MSALVDRIVAPGRIAALAAEAATLPRLVLDARELADLELIATGAASPLTGFAGEADYRRILAEQRLASGAVWPVPFVLAVGHADKDAVARAGAAALLDGAGRLWGVLRVGDVYARDPIVEARALHGTDDVNHPGVAYAVSRPRWAAGGDVEVLPLPDDLPLAAHRLTPRALRAEIAARGWTRVAGFATAGAIHRTDEHRIRHALEACDGVVIHAVVGDERGHDLPAEVRLRAHQALLAGYFPPERTLLAAFPAAPRHAGPREALLDTLLRKNYGITSPIVGPDHAGAGTFFCKVCDQIVSEASCPHDRSSRLELSAARVREILRTGGQLPRELARPEVAEILREHYLADVHAAVPATGPAVTPAPVRSVARGFIVWLTGMSGAGKSTLAAALAARIGRERPLEVLDGDEVRTHLSRGLGYSREDRDVNVHRIGFVARTLARHGVGVVTAAISPYAETRREVRALAERQGVAFVEVFAQAELAALVDRDVKGLYKKALAGEVTHFTGVSDPYEAPERPDVRVRSDLETVDQSLGKIVAALEARGLVAAAPARRSLGS